MQDSSQAVLRKLNSSDVVLLHGLHNPRNVFEEGEDFRGFPAKIPHLQLRQTWTEGETRLARLSPLGAGRRNQTITWSGYKQSIFFVLGSVSSKLLTRLSDFPPRCLVSHPLSRLGALSPPTSYLIASCSTEKKKDLYILLSFNKFAVLMYKTFSSEEKQYLFNIF